MLEITGILNGKQVTDQIVTPKEIINEFDLPLNLTESNFFRVAGRYTKEEKINGGFKAAKGTLVSPKG